MKPSKFLKVFWASIKADVWCLFHLRNRVLTVYSNVPESSFSSIVRIEAGIGNPFGSTWKTSKVFYEL